MNNQALIAGRYALGARIGEGGMGTVYRGVDSHSDEVVAIKLLKSDLVNTEMLARFAREGEALRQLNHPNIVKVLASGRDGSASYIVMELVGGGSLSDLLQGASSLPVERTLRIALDLCDALTRAHRLDIIHRDLKPANVLLADDGTPRLTDFGIALMAGKERVTETEGIVGTLSYLSPEAFGADGIDPRADIWAFGVMLFEMLAGKRPFDRATVTQTLMAILNEPTPDWEAQRPDCPIALVDLIYRMLEKDRSQRIPSVRQVGAELENILQGRASSPPNPLSASQRGGEGNLGQALFDTPTPSPAAIKHNLPAQTTPFVGREDELAELARLLSDANTRLVTILAPGGMGKTRLALEVGTRYISSIQNAMFPNGIFLVSLAPLTSPDFIVSTIAESVGFQFYQGGEPKQQLLDFFREKSLLLLMDNFEHVLSGAGIVGEILQTARHVKILATSRERLNLSGETLFSLSGMDFPDWETPEDALNYSAVKLFMQSAKRVRPDFELQADDLQYVARICRLVQGMPLGILLAASWVEVLSLKEIAAEIDQTIDFLETELRDVPERHRSIRAVFDYSWNLLTDDERAVFAKLSVFRGGFTREAAQAVADANLRTLMALVNKSLLRRNPDSGRYEIHELLRQYAENKIHESPDDKNSRDLHSAYYAEYLSQQYHPFFGKNQKPISEGLETEMENIRAAWSWAVEHGEVADISKSLPTLVLIYELFGWQQEGTAVFKHAAEKLTDNGAAEDDLLLWHLRLFYGVMSARLGNYRLFEDIAEKSLPVFRHHAAQREIIINLNSLAYIGIMRGEYAKGKGYAEEAATMLDGINDPALITATLGNLSYIAFLTGDYEAAIRINEDNLRRADILGNPNDRAATRNSLGEILHTLLKSEEASILFEESYTLFKEVGNRRGMAFALTNLGNVAHRVLRYEEALVRYEEALAIHRELGNRRGIAETLNMLGGAEWSLGGYSKAKPYHEEALKLFREMGDVRGISNSLAMLNVACLAVGEYAQSKTYAEECLRLRRSSDNSHEIADALGHVARAESLLGSYEAALNHTEEIMALMQQSGGFDPNLYGGYMGNKATILNNMGDFETAKQLSEEFMPHVEASGFKLAIVFTGLNLGIAQAGLGNWTEATAALRRSLQVSVEARGVPWILSNIVELAHVRGNTGNVSQAIEMLSFARESPSCLHQTKMTAEKYLQALKIALLSAEFTAAYERGKALELDTVVRDLLE